MDFKLDREEKRLKEYELNVQREEGKETTDLGYRDMNKRFLNLEQQTMFSPEAWEEKKKAHETRKDELEKKWHRLTEDRKKELDKSGNKNFSDKEAGYYENFSLKEMEVFLKNSDRGGNSPEFNSVATDLELYNVISDQGDTFELINLLSRLKESCDEYIRTRTTYRTPKGKRRRAMILQVQSKVESLLNDTYGSITADAGEAYKEFSAVKDDENTEEKKAVVEKACKTQFNQIFQDLSENKVLTKEQRQTADDHMKEILHSLKDQSADKNQSPNLSTRLFNAIGWAAHKPRLVRSFEDEKKKSPLGIKMYHSINPYGEMKDAEILGEQLKGELGQNSRQYYSAGNYGKGTYTAVRSKLTEDRSKEEKDRIDKKASNHSWEFGDKVGAVQFTMMLNENARIINFTDAISLVKEFKAKYPQTYQAFRELEIREGYGYAEEPAITALLAFYGYNTLRFMSGCGPDIDYYITTDRKAFSINDNTQMMRTEKGFEAY